MYEKCRKLTQKLIYFLNFFNNNKYKTKVQKQNLHCKSKHIANKYKDVTLSQDVEYYTTVSLIKK